MNFERDQSFQRQLSGLLAMVIMFQKQIEELKKKLSGNQEFHTRLIFESMDFGKKGEITPEDLINSLSSNQYHFGLTSSQALCRKYTVSGAITYEELLAMIIPKTDKALAQRVLIRISKRGATLPNYLWKYFSQLFIMILLMTVLTDEARRKMQNSVPLNHLQLVEFFKKVLRSDKAIWRFCNQNSDQEYDFSVKDANFLSNHIRSRNPLPEMTDQDIKQLLCPLDMNFQKTDQEMGSYYQKMKAEKYKTEYGVFYYQMKLDQQERKRANINFLKTDYHTMYPSTRKLKQNKNYNIVNSNIGYQNPNHVPAEKQYIKQQDSNIKSLKIISDRPMYLDKFIKQFEYEPERDGIELDKYLSRRKERGNEYERFEDELNQNGEGDNSNSAFVQQ